MPEFITYIITNRYVIIGAILLACFVGYVAYLNFRLNELNAASAKFRTAITAELGTIYPIITNWPRNEDAFFKAAFPNLQVAVTEFRHFVPWCKRRDFDNAWLRYYCAYPENTKGQIYLHYMASFDPLMETQEIATARRNKTFYTNVSQLLSFAGNK